MQGIGNKELDWMFCSNWTILSIRLTFSSTDFLGKTTHHVLTKLKTPLSFKCSHWRDASVKNCCYTRALLVNQFLLLSDRIHLDQTKAIQTRPNSIIVSMYILEDYCKNTYYHHFLGSFSGAIYIWTSKIQINWRSCWGFFCFWFCFNVGPYVCKGSTGPISILSPAIFMLIFFSFVRHSLIK